MFVAKLPGSMYATQAMNAGPRNGRIRNRVRWSASSTVRSPAGNCSWFDPNMGRV